MCGCGGRGGDGGDGGGGGEVGGEIGLRGGDRHASVCVSISVLCA